MYFQLEVDYYSNEDNKNKYKNVQLIASTKNNLKIATYCLVAWACCCLKVMFVSARYKSFYIYINTIYVNKNQHSPS